MSSFSPTARLTSIVCGALLAATVAGAQETRPSTERLVLGSRAAQAESAASVDSDPQNIRSERRAEALALRNRLREGDFHAGDRITLWVNGEAALTNTFTVRVGNVLELPGIGEVSLRGVLRSELRDVLEREIGRYIKEPQITVTTLVNVAILGAVTRPGFYSVAPDAPLGDVLMTAGGPAANADLGRSKISRGGSDVLAKDQLQRALQTNKTIDDIAVQSGDQIVVGERTRRWGQLASVLTLVAVLSSSAVFLLR